MWDVFLSHASEDKPAVVEPLYHLLKKMGLHVWYDAQTLTLGDSLRRKIDEGLANCRFGVVVLSKHFFAKEWPQKELDGLVAREDGKQKLILPVWHGVTQVEVAKFSPMLAGKVAVSMSQGLERVVEEILRAMQAGEQAPLANQKSNSAPEVSNSQLLEELRRLKETTLQVEPGRNPFDFGSDW